LKVSRIGHSAARRLTITKFAHKAGIVGDAKLAAAVALFDMTAQRCRTAGFDGAHDPTLAAAQMAGMGLTVGGTVAAEDIRHLDHRA